MLIISKDYRDYYPDQEELYSIGEARSPIILRWSRGEWKAAKLLYSDNQKHPDAK